MKTLYFDLSMGAAGDMLTGALLELFDDSDSMVSKLNKIGIPNVRIETEKSDKCGIIGTHVRVIIGDGDEESSYDNYDMACDAVTSEKNYHEYRHEHKSLSDIIEIINELNVSEKVKKQAIEVYTNIANAESRVHGKSVTEIHFHEVGMVDAISDVVNVLYLVQELGVDEIVASPVNTGTGQVKCAHGILPVPAPATVNLLKGIPAYGKGEGERCTPTGAALIGTLVDRFETGYEMTIDAVGYGMGTRDFEQANCVRAMLGHSENNRTNDEVIELDFNVDDITGEELAFAVERIFEAGAVEVFSTPIYMKKGRPGTLVTVLVKEESLDRVVKTIFKNTTTVGIRKKSLERYILNREIKSVETDYGTIRYKQSEGYGVIRRKLEFEDIASLARKSGKSVLEIERAIDMMNE